MKQKIFIVISLLSALLIPFTYVEIVTINPGWHTDAFYGAKWYHFLLPLIFAAIAILYSRTDKQNIILSKVFFKAHVLISLALIVYIYLQFISLYYFQNNTSGQLYSLYILHQLVSYTFTAGQLLIAVNLSNKIKSARAAA